MIGSIFYILLAMALLSCESNKARNDFEDIPDYGLSDENQGAKLDDRAYFDDLQKSEAVVAFESSLPLPISVNKAVDPFDSPPPITRSTAMSQLSVQFGNCRFSLKTASVQVDRYLLAGQWIKFSEALPAGKVIKLEPRMDINFKVLTRLQIDIPASQRAACQRLLQGKKTVLGRFHLNKSRIGFLPGEGSPKINFSSRSMEPKGKKVWIRWPMDAHAPSLIDDFDFPATCESGIFRALMGSKGFYYLLFQPVLRMEGFDQMVIKLAYPPSLPSSTEKDSSPGNQIKKPKDKVLDPKKLLPSQPKGKIEAE